MEAEPQQHNESEARRRILRRHRHMDQQRRRHMESKEVEQRQHNGLEQCKRILLHRKHMGLERCHHRVAKVEQRLDIQAQALEDIDNQHRHNCMELASLLHMLLCLGLGRPCSRGCLGRSCRRVPRRRMGLEQFRHMVDLE